MASPPGTKWPFQPHWELDGFHFGRLPAVHHFDTAMQRVLENPEFTSVSSVTARNNSSLSEYYSRRVSNNVAVQFRAMLYCKGSHPNPVFWERVQHCSHRCGLKAAEVIGDMFIKARKAYLAVNNRCPNEAAKLVDEWLAFLNSGPRRFEPAARTPVKDPWDTRYHEWVRIRERGGLMDAGQFPSDRPGAAAPQQQPAHPTAGSTSHTYDAVVKREEGDFSDDSSFVDLGSTTPNGFGNGTSGGSKRRGTENWGSRSSKRRVDASARAPQMSGSSENFHLRSPPLSSPLAQRRRQGDPAPVVPASSSPLARQTGSVFAVPANNDNAGPATASHTDCAAQNAETRKLMLDQDLKISDQMHMMVRLGTKTDIAESRIRVLEDHMNSGHQGVASGAGNQQEPSQEQLKALQESVAELEKTSKNRATSLRSQIKTQWKEIHEPQIAVLTKEQGRRIDGLGTDLGVLTKRVDDGQKEVDEKMKKQEEGLKSVEKKARSQGKTIDKVSARLDRLEELSANKAASDSGSEDSSSDDEDASAANAELEARLASCLTRMDQLDERFDAQERAAALDKKQRQSAADKVHHRIKALESRGSAAEKEAKAQTARAEKLEREMEALKKQVSGLQSQVHKDKNRRKSSA